MLKEVAEALNSAPTEQLAAGEALGRMGEGVTAVLEHERDINVVGAANSIDEGLRLAAKLRPEGHRIVVFTAHDTDEDVFGAIRGGARGYLLK